MRRLSHALLTTLVLCLLAACNADKIANLQKENGDLREQVKKSNLDSQAKCSSAAKEWFDVHWGRPFPDTILLDYHNHYSVILNKCFIEVEWHWHTGGLRGNWANSITVVDVYENNEYGRLIESHNPDENYTDVRSITTCQTGGNKCSSLEEFNRRVNNYLTD